MAVEAPLAPPAAVTPPPATPPPAAPPAPAPKTNDDPWMARILEDMGKVIQGDELVDAPPKAPEATTVENASDFTSMGEHVRFKKERAEAKAAKDAAAPPADPAAPAAPAPGTPPPAAAAPPAPEPPKKPKIEVEKAKPIEEIVEGVVRRLSQDQKPPTPPAPKIEIPPEVVDADADYVEALDEDQKEAVELARFAAKSMPDKYANMPKRMVEYLKKVDGYIDGKRKEDSDWDPDSDEGFAAFIEENQPTYQSGDRKRLQRSQIVEETRAEVRKEFAPKIEEGERQARVNELKPEIDKAVDSYEVAVAQRFIPDEKSPFFQVFKAANSKDPTFTEEAWKEAQAVDPLATSVARNFMGQAKSLGREYLELVGGIARQAPYDPKQPPSSPANQKALTQQRLFGFIDQQEQIFARDGGDMRTVNGRSFVTRRELAAMPAAEQAKHWTLGHEDVLDMLAVAAATQANQTLAAEVKRREDEGYVRNGKQPAPKPETAPPPTAGNREPSPKATTTPAPGAANPPPPPSQPTVFTEEDLKKQWSGGASSWLG